MLDKIGLFTGSFDPLTNGHIDLICRASDLFDRLYLGIFYNPRKIGMLSLSQRQEILEDVFGLEEKIYVLPPSDELVADVARRYGVTHLVRGLRNGVDLEYESSFDFYNRRLNPELETIYLLAKPELKFISSSQIRELIHFQQDISSYVPQAVIKKVEMYAEK